MNQTPKSLFPYYKKVDLSYREHWREYIFPNGERIRIDSPQYLIVSDNGHRVMDNRIAHYVPYGWIELIWEPKEGYGFYCEGDDEIDPAEDEDLGHSICPVDIDGIEKKGVARDQEDWQTSHDLSVEKRKSDLRIKTLNGTISNVSSVFLRFFKDQLDNADHNKNTIEYQTLGRVENKFLDLFRLWIREQDESEEEPEQNSTESTE